MNGSFFGDGVSAAPNVELLSCALREPRTRWRPIAEYQKNSGARISTERPGLFSSGIANYALRSPISADELLGASPRRTVDSPAEIEYDVERFTE